MTDRDLLEMIAAQIGGLTTQVGGLTTQIDNVTVQVNTLTHQMDTVTVQVNTLTHQMDTVTVQVNTLTQDMTELKKDVKKINNTIENDVTTKLEALFDGYVHNSEKLNRIEAEVIKHDEFILKRIK